MTAEPVPGRPGWEALAAAARANREDDFAQRADLLDALEFAPPGPAAAGAEGLKADLEALDAALFARLRAALRGAADPPAAFRGMLAAYVPAPMRLGTADAGYDLLDAFCNGLFHARPLPEPARPLEEGMVAYQKTPARIILELADAARVAPADAFCDVGAGLGQVAIALHLLTGARTEGIEADPAYAEYARACAGDLGLSAVGFRAVDAREADYSGFDAIFLYTPFRGRLLEAVLDRMRAQCRPGTRVCTYGPCTAEVARQPWLRPRATGTLGVFARA